MTKDELMKYFSPAMYDYCREYIYRIMLERPDVDDPVHIMFAADRMDECAGDGVELSVDNALRLSVNDKAPDMNDLIKILDNAGITSDNIVDKIFSHELFDEDYTGCVPSEKAKLQFRLLNEQADKLAEANPDIIVMGRPVFSPFADSGRLAIALLCPTLTKTEQNICQVMKTMSNGAKVSKKASYILLQYFVEPIWEKP